MTPSLFALVQESVALALGLGSLALVLAFVRLLRGPTLPDRVVALDLIGTLSVGMIAGFDIATGQPVLLDAAMVAALVAFLGTVAFGRYVERNARHD